MDSKFLRAGLLGSMAIPFDSLMRDLVIEAEPNFDTLWPRKMSLGAPRHSGYIIGKPALSKKMAKARAATQRQRAARRQTRLHLK